jgi:hypothetical protein
MAGFVIKAIHWFLLQWFKHRLFWKIIFHIERSALCEDTRRQRAKENTCTEGRWLNGRIRLRGASDFLASSRAATKIKCAENEIRRGIITHSCRKKCLQWQTCSSCTHVRSCLVRRKLTTKRSGTTLPPYTLLPPLLMRMGGTAHWAGSDWALSRVTESLPWTY